MISAMIYINIQTGHSFLKTTQLRPNKNAWYELFNFKASIQESTLQKFSQLKRYRHYNHYHLSVNWKHCVHLFDHN